MITPGGERAEFFLGSLTPIHVLEAAPDAMILVDHAGAIAYVNAEAEALFRFDRAELIGRPIEELVPLDQRASHAARRDDYLTNPHTRPMGKALKIVARRRDGSEFHADIKLSPLKVAAGLFVMAAVRDVSERARVEATLRAYAGQLERFKAKVDGNNEELARYNQELEQLAYVSSHHLQEPLRKIVAFGDRLRAHVAGSLDERAQGDLDRIQAASRRMQALINDLLAYASLTTRARPFKQVDLAAVARAAVADLAPSLERAGGTIHVGELWEVRGDAAQLELLIHNLLENAIRFHRPDEPPLISIWGSAEGAPAKAGSATYAIHVRDNGIGIEPRFFDRIFTVFERLHPHGRYEGTGVGLSIVKKIAERHGGGVRVESEPGVGSTFTVTLSVPESEEASAR